MARRRTLRWLMGAAAVLLAAGCGTASSDKAGGTRKHGAIVLTLASPNPNSFELEPFAAAVARLSHGTLRIEYRNHWHQGAPSYEPETLGDVQAGRVDLAWVGSRAFDDVGVRSFDALHAPLLIDSYALEGAVLRSGLPEQMLQGLRRPGLVGLGILPGPMRKPLGVARMAGPEDYRGRTIAISRSRVAAASLAALGAHAVPIAVQAPIDAYDGVELHVAAIQGNHYDEAAHYLTANVNLWPRPLVVVMNERAYGKLDAAQRTALRAASASALAPTLALQRSMEREAAGIICRTGTVFIIAAPRDLAALRRAVRPVYGALERDPATKAAIAQISALRTEVGAGAEGETPTCAATAQPSAGGRRTPLDGVYTLTTTREESRRAGTPEGDLVSENYGRWRFTFDRGRLSYTQSSEGASRWTRAVYTVRGDVLTFRITAYGGESPNGAAEKTGEIYAFRWSRYRDRLALAPAKGAISPLNFRLKPWRRVGDAP